MAKPSRSHVAWSHRPPIVFCTTLPRTIFWSREGVGKSKQVSFERDRRILRSHWNKRPNNHHLQTNIYNKILIKKRKTQNRGSVNVNSKIIQVRNGTAYDCIFSFCSMYWFLHQSLNYARCHVTFASMSCCLWAAQHGVKNWNRNVHRSHVHYMYIYTYACIYICTHAYYVCVGWRACGVHELHSNLYRSGSICIYVYIYNVIAWCQLGLIAWCVFAMDQINMTTASLNIPNRLGENLRERKSGIVVFLFKPVPEHFAVSPLEMISTSMPSSGGADESARRT